MELENSVLRSLRKHITHYLYSRKGDDGSFNLQDFFSKYKHISDDDKKNVLRIILEELKCKGLHPRLTYSGLEILEKPKQNFVEMI